MAEPSGRIYVQRFKPGQAARRESLLGWQRRCGGSWRGFLQRGTRGARRKHAGTPDGEKISTPQVSRGPRAALVVPNLGKKQRWDGSSQGDHEARAQPVLFAHLFRLPVCKHSVGECRGLGDTS